MAFTHIMVGTNDLEKSTAFYDAALAPLGLKNIGGHDRATLYGDKSWEFIVTKPANGEAATHANGGTIGFAAPSRAAVDAFHEAALANGGTCEGPPGPRAFDPNAYGAYVRDPVGNKICAYCFLPE